MNKQIVMHRKNQLEMLAEILEAIAEEKVTLNTKTLAIELVRDEAFMDNIGAVIGLPDVHMAVRMLAGYNEDNLYRAHILLQDELWEG